MNTSPVVVDGTVYVAGSGDPGYIYAVDAATGEAEWQFEPAGYATSAPAHVDDILYVGTWGKRFHALDATTGDELWSTDIGHRIGSSSPVVVGGTIYVGTYGDGPLVVSGPEDEAQFEACALLALDAETGDERWRYDEFGEKDNISSSPAVAGNMIYVGCLNGISAVTTAGESVWRIDFERDRDDDPYVESSPAVSAGTVFIGASDGRLHAITDRSTNG